MIKIHIFHTGSVIVDRAIPYKDKNPLAVTGFLRGRDMKLMLPVSAYLIEHPKGKVLIDTGWDSKYATERPHRFFGLPDGISTHVIKNGESIDCKPGVWAYPHLILIICFSVIWILFIPAVFTLSKMQKVLWLQRKNLKTVKILLPLCENKMGFCECPSVSLFRYRTRSRGKIV